MTPAFSALKTMPGESVLALTIDILANEAARKSTLEAQLATLGQPFDPINRVVILALNAAVDVLVHTRACGQDAKVKGARAPEWVVAIVNQARAALMDDGFQTTAEAVEEPEVAAS